MMEYFLKEPEVKLQHNLNPLFEEIKSFKTRRQYEKSALYKMHGEEIRRIENGVEWQNITDSPESKESFRVVAWNVERGRNFEGIIHLLKTDEHLSQADVLLLTETDIGMGRSGNHNVPREIAAALGMNYCFANSFIGLSKGDEGEQDHELENTLALHGAAILSKYKMISAQTCPLSPYRDDFNSFEKRLGRRNGLICKIRVGSRECDFAVVHLDLKASPRQRARQLHSMLKVMSLSNARVQLIGGDFNTHTYNLRNKFSALTSFGYKALFLGFNQAISHYMAPEKFFEKPLFDMLAREGFNFENYNDKSKGTLYYDINDMASMIKTRSYTPDFFLKWLERRLKPWNGRVPLRLDWLAGKGCTVLQKQSGIYGPPQTIELPCCKGRRISDHYPVVVDLVI